MVADGQLPDGKADGREQQHTGDDVHRDVPQRDCGQLDLACSTEKVKGLGFRV